MPRKKKLPPGKTEANIVTGRHTKYTPDIHKKFLAYIDEGQRFGVAALLCRLEPLTVRNWLKRGAQGEEPFVSFSNEYAEKQAIPEARAIQAITKAFHDEGEWRAAEFYLKSRKPKHYLEKARVELSGPDGEAIETKNENTSMDDYDYSLLTIEELRTLRALRQKAKRNS